MRLRWCPTAANDLEAIYAYLRQHHAGIADSTIIKLYNGIESLLTLPNRGRRAAKKELANWFLHCSLTSWRIA